MSIGEDGWEPLRHLTPPDRCRCRLMCGLGEGTTLRSGWDIGSICGKHGFEDVSGFGDVVGVGDDEKGVGAAAAGGGDVEAASGGRR